MLEEEAAAAAAAAGAVAAEQVAEAAASALMEAEAGAGSELRAVGHRERWTGTLAEVHRVASAQQDWQMQQSSFS